MNGSFYKRLLYPGLISVLLAVLLLGTSCFKDLQINPSAVNTGSHESTKTVTPHESGGLSVEPGPGANPGGFQPSVPLQSDSQSSGNPSREPTSSDGTEPDTGPTYPPGESNTHGYGEFDWWSDNPFPINLRYSLGTPERETTLKFIEVPIIEIRNSLIFEFLRGPSFDLRGSLIFDKEFNTAELLLYITPYEKGYARPTGQKGSRHIHATVNFEERQFTSLDFTNINNLANFITTETWLYEKLCDLRLQAVDVMILHLSQLANKDDLYKMDIAHTLEYENEKTTEIVGAELSYEPVIDFYNPKKELGEANQDLIHGKLQLDHDLLRGRLEVNRDFSTNAGKGTGTAQAWLLIDFSNGIFQRSDEPYKDEEAFMHWVDYPDAILYELAESLRTELFAVIASGRAETIEEVIVYD